MEWLWVPTREADRRRAQQQKEARRRYELNHPEHHKSDPRKNHHGTKKVLKENLMFIVWDGEGPQDTRYSLFGNSEGMEICYPTLSTIDCLNLILEAGEQYPAAYAVHVGFGFDYDVSNIIKDLPWRQITALKKYNRTVWNGYEIEHIPHKWFAVKRGKVKVKIFDVYLFFMSRLVDALEKWEIGPWKTTAGVSASVPLRSTGKSSYVPDASDSSALIPRMILQNTDSSEVPSLASALTMNDREMVEAFKEVRGSFLWKDISQIRLYMRLELKYTRSLMERLRDVFTAAGYLPDSWHGPGALARMALKRHNVYDAMAICPAEVRIAARYAYVGGRFSPHLVGHMGTGIFCADRNSAYPYATLELPNLSRGTWRRGKKFEPGKFAMYHIRYQSTPRAFAIYPLPKRGKNAEVVWPYRVTGWYWTPEAETVSTDSEAEFLEAWVFDEDDETDRPFAWIAEYFRRRLMLKRQGNPAEFTFKLIINAVYGQLAQRAGWDRNKNEAPRSHQLEWAGYVTSHCRAAMYRLTQLVGEDNVISIDTDGITTTKPVPLPPEEVGSELGQFGVDEYEDGVFWQSGMYALKDDGVWVKARTRGIPKGDVGAEHMLAALKEGNHVLRSSRNRFNGYGSIAYNSREKMNTWSQSTASYVLGGNGKVSHNSKLCPKICDGEIHKLMNLNMLYGPFTDPVSEPHFLPWLENAKEMAMQKNLIDDMTLFGEDWAEEYA